VCQQFLIAEHFTDLHRVRFIALLCQETAVFGTEIMPDIIASETNMMVGDRLIVKRCTDTEIIDP